MFVVSKAIPQLPLQIEDASRPERPDDAEDDGFVRVNADTRLDNRILDFVSWTNIVYLSNFNGVFWLLFCISRRGRYRSAQLQLTLRNTHLTI